MRLKDICACAILIVSLLMAPLLSHAQNSYLRVGGGYALGALKTDWTDLYPFMGSPSSETTKIDAFSLGQGFHAGGAYGYKINDHLGVELGISYFRGSQQYFDTRLIMLDFEESEDGRPPTIEEGNLRRGFEAKVWQLTPALVLEAGFEKLNPYGRLGLVVGVGTIEQSVDAEFPSLVLQSRQERTGGVHLGIAAGLGVQYHLSDRWSLYAECTFIGMEMTPEKGLTIQQEVNGVDQVDDLPPNIREVIYTDDYLEYTDQDDPQAPRREPRTTFPMSSIGLHVGAMLRF